MSEKKRRAKMERLNTMIEYASEFTGPTPKIKVKKKSGDDTLTPGAKNMGKTIGKAWKGYVKSPTIIKEGVSKFVKQVKDTAYKEKTGVDMEGKRTGDKVKVKLKKKKK